MLFGILIKWLCIIGEKMAGYWLNTEKSMLL